MVTHVPYRPLPMVQGYDVLYEHGPDSTLRPGVVAGETREIILESSDAFPGTKRRVWIHTPNGHDPKLPAALTVFNDGWWYFDPAGDFRGATVLDNLVAEGVMPTTVGVFVDPGHFDLDEPKGKNRNVEYDAFDDRYLDLISNEVLPLVEREVVITDVPELRCICGGSSGGNAALTAAWRRPDMFGKVIALLPGLPQLPTPGLLAEEIAGDDRRPLKIFLQAAHRDLGWNEPTDNNLADGLRLAAVLAEKGYDFRLVLDDGGHSPNHGGVLLPDAFRWLWQATSST